MFYGGESNVPGAPGNNAGMYGGGLAGTWATRDFPQGQQPEATELYRRGIQNTPLEQRIQNLREVIKSNPGSLFTPQVNQGVGNMGGMMATANAGFFAGPQLGQLAQNQGPSTPVKYDESMKGFVPNQGATYPSNIRYKNFPGV